MALDREWMSLEESLKAADDIEKLSGAYHLVAAAIRYYNIRHYDRNKNDDNQSKRLEYTARPNGSN
jgi:hypothetical protein